VTALRDTVFLAYLSQPALLESQWNDPAWNLEREGRRLYTGTGIGEAKTEFRRA